MKFLLLAVIVLACDSFSLTAGSEASSDLSVCVNGWVEFSCSYPNASITKYHSAEVLIPRLQQTLQSFESDRWEPRGSVLLYHDTMNRKLRVTIKQLLREDFGQFQCRFYPGAGSVYEISNVDLFPEVEPCQICSQTANTAGETTLTCQKRGKKLQILFFCKDKDLICEEILSTSTSLSNGRFTLGVTPHNFSLSIRDVSSEDAGVYWCGGKPMDGRYRAPIAKIQLEVKALPRPTSTSAEPHVSLSSTTSTATDTPEAGGSNRTVAAAVLVFVALLAFVLLSVVVYRRLNKTNGKTQTIKEDHIYAEIQEKADSGTVMNTLYDRANFPMKPLVSAVDPTVQACSHYSTVGDHVQRRTSAADQPPTSPGEALYSTVNLPQQY